METTDKKPALKKDNKAEKETKKTTPKKVDVEQKESNGTTHPLDMLIENIKADRVLLMIQDEKLTECKKAKSDISSRLKGYKSDLKVFMRYATEEQKQAVEELGLETTTRSPQTLNQAVEIALKIVQEKKKLTNGELFDEYVNRLPKEETAESYTFFNIKIRSLFNRQILKKTKGENPKSSRTDVITLNESKSE